MNFDNQKKQIFSYLIYQLACWIAYMIILSISTFFHFLLEHRLGVIEDWLFEYSWQMVSLAKIAGFLTVISFYKIKFDVGNPLVNFFYEGNRPISLQLVKVIFFIMVSVVVFGKFELVGIGNAFKMLSSYTSAVSFFMLDVVLLFMLQKIWPLDRKEKSLNLYLFALIFIIASKISYLISKDHSLVFLIHIFIAIKLSWSRRFNWSNPLIYLLLITGPLVALVGVDPMWGSDFALLKSFFGRNYIYLYTILIIAFAYIEITSSGESIKIGGLRSGSKSN